MTGIDRKSQFLDLYVEVTKTITSCLELDELFSLICTKLSKTLEVDATTLRLMSPSRKRLKLKSAYGLSDAYLDRGAIDVEEPVFKALKGEPILIKNAAGDPRITYQEETRREGIDTILVVPIPIRGRIEGVLRLLTKSPRDFQQDEINFVSAIAEQCGIAIENARFIKEQETQLNYFVMIHELSKRINSTGDLNEILDLIVTRLPEIMSLKAATIRFFEKKGKLELKAAYGLSDTYLARGSLDKEAATRYLREGEPFIIIDAKTDIHTIYQEEARAEGIGSIMAVPIFYENEVLGILRLLTSEIRYFTSADINFAMAIAAHGGIAIQKAIDNDLRAKHKSK